MMDECQNLTDEITSHKDETYDAIRNNRCNAKVPQESKVFLRGFMLLGTRLLVALFYPIWR